MGRFRSGIVRRLMRMAEHPRFETPKGWSVFSRCVSLGRGDAAPRGGRMAPAEPRRLCTACSPCIGSSSRVQQHVHRMHTSMLNSMRLNSYAA